MTERVYMIGSGVIARLHHEAIRRHTPDAEIHICDLSADCLQAMQADDPALITHSNHKEMLAAPACDTDIVIVCTPPSSHAALSIDALASGRHVLCEKPFALTTGDAEAMLAAAEQAQRRVACCSMRFIEQDALGQLKAGIKTGRCGELYRIAWQSVAPRSRSGIEFQAGSYWFLRKNANGGGALMDWAPYDMMILLDLLDAQSVQIQQAWLAQPRTALPKDLDPDSVDVEFHGGASLLVTTPSGARVGIDFERASCCHGEHHSRFHCYGSDGGATIDWLPWGEGCALRWFADDGGQLTHSDAELADTDLAIQHIPYVRFRRHINDTAVASAFDQHAVFALSVLRGIYTAAESGTPITCTLTARPSEITA
ncbi:MAG: Gfo/Idh/MocA family oxidoreductase [Planctomycetota bacterium]|jgi:predicted dehydrogenase|nr:Gfo/Idh/MocA family oxidoreductase [Planctomycetota bacterium]